MKSLHAPKIAWIYGLAVLAFMRSWRPLTRFNYTHWLFSYEFGPTKRGWVGEMLRQMGVSRDYALISILAIVLQ